MESPRQFLEEYELADVIGEGAYGVVYRCRHIETGEECAVKMIDKVENEPENIKMEIKMQSKLAHPTIVNLRKVFYEKVFVCMVMDIYTGGCLIDGMHNYMTAKGDIPASVSFNMVRQALASIKWLHSQSVVHRDIKGDNYVMDREDVSHPECKIYMLDFGTAVEVQPHMRLSARCGTAFFWAPEIYNGSYGLKVDVFALGVLTYGLLCGRFPFKNQREIMVKIVKFKATTDPGLLRLQRLCQLLLTKEEEKRPDSHALGEFFGPPDRNSPSSSGQDIRALGDAASLHQRQTHSDWDLKNGKSERIGDDELRGEAAANTLDPRSSLAGEEEQNCRERAPNKSIKQRREELVDRIQKARISVTAASLNTNHLKAGHSILSQGRRITYEWWPLKKAEEMGIFDSIGTEMEGAKENDMRVGDIELTLDSHHVDRSKLCVGSGVTYEQFLNDIMSGDMALMLDAAEHKTLCRVVDIVYLRLTYTDDKGNQYHLLTASDEGKTPTGLPFAKKMAVQNNTDAVVKLLSDLSIPITDVQIETNQCEYFEEEDRASLSSAMPGVKLVYRKYIMPVNLCTTTADQLLRLGLSMDKKLYTVTPPDASIRTTYVWVSKAQYATFDIKVSAPPLVSSVSALVNPPTGFDEDQLKKYLETYKWDMSRFGLGTNRTLAEFADELMSGEARIMNRGGTLLRVVDVVVLKITRSDDHVLIEVSESVRDGATQTLNRMPAVKRRPLEHQFIAAKRVITDIVDLDPECVHLINEEVNLFTKTSDSRAYVGLLSEYRKRVVNATVKIS